MKTYYVITQSAKSKGFLKQFSKNYYRSTPSMPMFTKQFALAMHFDSVEHAQEQIDQAIEDCVKMEKEVRENLKTSITYSKISRDDLTEEDVRDYGKAIGDRFWAGNVINRRWGNDPSETFKGRFYKHIQQKITDHKTNLETISKKKAFLKEKLFIHEGEVELKFKDSERLKRQWHENTSTKNCYCSNCGCSVPEAYYLSWGGRWANVRICQFCMEALAEESKQYTAKADPEIKQLWEQSYFLHEMDC